MNTSPKNGITLILGPANSGKMGRVLDWWQERLPLRPLVVLPTAPDALQASAEMAQRAGGLVGQDAAVTFDGLVRQVLGRSPRYATDLERTLIVSCLLRDLPVGVLGGSERLPSLAPALAVLLQQLSDSGRAPEEIEAVLRRWASVDPHAAVLASEICELAAAFAGKCSELGLADRPPALRETMSAASGWQRPLALYGFTSFTGGQRNLLEALSRSVEVLIAFTHRREHKVGLIRPDELAWWMARAGRVVESEPDALSYAAPAIAYLERYAASDGPRPGPPAAGSAREGVCFVLASGRRAEAEAAAERIAELLRAGVRPADIGVVVRQVRQWSSLLGDVFDSCGIIYHMDDRCLLGETGLGHAFLGALKGVVFDDDSGLFSYLRSPYSGLGAQEAADLELFYRRRTARGARALAGAAGEGCRESVRRLWDLVLPGAADPGGGVGPGGAGAMGSARAAGSVIDPVEAAALAQRMLVAGSIGTEPDSGELREDARAFRAIQIALETIGVLAAGRGPDDALDSRLLLRVLAKVVVPSVGGDCGDAVQVLSAQRARARRFEAVLVLGLVEGEFPGRPDTPSLLSSAQRARLDQLGDGLLAPEIDQEEALFVSAASRARRLLYLSARDAEDDGGEAAPSRFWQSAKNLLGVGSGEHEVRTLAELVFAPCLAPSARHYLRGCAASGVALESLGPDVRLDRPVRPWKTEPPRLTDPTVLEELASLDCFSPSALESYSGCPFAWFVERVVGVDDLEVNLDAQTMGELLHSALSATYAELAQRGLLPLRPEGLPAAEGVAMAAIDEAVQSERCPGSLAQRRLATCRLKGMVRGLLARESGSNSGFTPSETETWVGGRQGVDIGGLRIRGRIDRVDATAGGDTVFVIDYKSGKTPSANALGTEEALQLPLYLRALAVERPNVRVAGGAYLSLAEGKRVGVVSAGFEGVLGAGGEGCRVLDEDGAAELYERTLAIARVAAAGMRAGEIAPRFGRQCPPWCRLGPACRSGSGGYRP